LEAFLLSTGVVAVAEIGDKTQLLALLLASRFRRPWPIVLGILLATLANHGAAAALGATVGGWLDGPAFRAALGLSFVAMAFWCLKPDTLDGGEARWRFGPFLTTLVAFFLVEIGDKTQLATIGLAARYADLALVTAGTTAGMLIANAPVVLLGDRLARCLPLGLVRKCAAGLFLALGVLVLIEAAAAF
jgi:putative Ca2+/H+ antiporter (TMEM165/GDT1 family)